MFTFIPTQHRASACVLTPCPERVLSNCLQKDGAEEGREGDGKKEGRMDAEEERGRERGGRKEKWGWEGRNGAKGGERRREARLPALRHPS